MKKRYKVLVVDDDPKELLLMEALLKPYSYDVVMLTDGKRTIKTARDEKPDIILLDIVMPSEDGYTLLNKIKRDKTMSNIPVVMISALGYDGNKVFASICGASAYITKPIDRKVLLETIAHFLHGSASSS
jgi:twitching motility two-component system response regulator PilH